jgi:hypothetical protein
MKGFVLWEGHWTFETLDASSEPSRFDLTVHFEDDQQARGRCSSTVELLT